MFVQHDIEWGNVTLNWDCENERKKNLRNDNEYDESLPLTGVIPFCCLDARRFIWTTQNRKIVTDFLAHWLEFNLISSISYQSCRIKNGFVVVSFQFWKNTCHDLGVLCLAQMAPRLRIKRFTKFLYGISHICNCTAHTHTCTRSRYPVNHSLNLHAHIYTKTCFQITICYKVCVR